MKYALVGFYLTVSVTLYPNLKETFFFAYLPLTMSEIFLDRKRKDNRFVNVCVPYVKIELKKIED